MANPLGVFEDIHTTPRQELFTLLGVRWLVTPYAWLSLPLYTITGVIMALLLHEDRAAANVALTGFAYGIVLFVTNVLHSVGHILGGKAVRRPMNANLVTATRMINLYTGTPQGLPSRVHLARAGGGPLLNGAVGILALIVWLGVANNDLLYFCGVVNLAAALITLLPVRSLDGEVIWRELRRT